MAMQIERFEQADAPRKRGWEIVQEYERIIETMCPDGVWPDDATELNAALAAVGGEAVDKVAAYQVIYERIRAEHTALTEAKRHLADKMARKLAANESAAARVTALCEEMVRGLQLEKVATHMGTARYQAGADRIEILDEQAFCLAYAGKQITVEGGRTVEVVTTKLSPKLQLLGELHREGVDISSLGARAVKGREQFRVR